MGSESNNINDGTSSFQPSEPTLCANNCGFFGSSGTMNLCSKCFRDLSIEEQQVASVKVAVEKFMNYPNQSKSQQETDVLFGESSRSDACNKVVEEETKYPNRCLCCKKKVGVMGFKCKCGSTFCGSHRYPEKHGCTFDFKSQGKEAIEKANPVVKGNKMETGI
ncbi:hypothetical protein LIER_09879 [Lithospermum erythrorhizon]|uniref:Uncharacterized protein n=1 Tax=Lithospermum erythrorhizon TaxID=34254 RepID=A0AAV3PL87_LITER